MSGAHNLAILAEESFTKHGDRDALVFEGRTWRASELRDRVMRAAGGLVRIGVLPGDRVAVVMSNCPEVGLTYGAIWRAGAVVTPIVFLATPAELRHILADSGAVAVVTTSEFAGNVIAAARDTESVRHVIVAGGWAASDAGLAVVDFAELESAEPIDIVRRADDDLAALLYTGGTTGRAKGVMLTHGSLWFCGKSAHDASYVPGLVRTLLPLPLSHVYGLLVTIVGLHSVEPGLTVLMRWFDPAQYVALAVEHRVQRTALVPAMLQLLLTQPLADADLSELRYVTCGAAPLAPQTREAFEALVPTAQVTEGYGLTESAAVLTTNPPGRRRVGSVGLPIPGVELRIVDDDDAELPTGTDGEICGRSPGIMQGYWHDDEETARTLRAGWLHTGDIGHLDDDGYLYIVDRKKDVIIRGGFNVYPRDVEDVLLEHPAVAMAGVVGTPHPTLGEEPVAFVALHPGHDADPAELVEFARARLAATKYPRDVRVVDAIPLTSVGKLDRKALRARLS